MERRITLVNSADRLRQWQLGPDAPCRIVFAASFKVLRYALANAAEEYEQDVERVIIDRTATADDFLDLVAHISENFAGDVLYVRDLQRGYLSACGRGGNRVLYSLEESDLRFYLETHALTAPSDERSAPSSVAAA